MVPTNRTATHPGEILRDEFLGKLGVPQTELALKLGIPVRRINEIVDGKRGVTPDPAWLFAAAFGTTPEFWMNLQTIYDLSRSRPTRVVAWLRVPTARTARRSGKSSHRRRASAA